MPDLVPCYDTREKTILIGKAVDFNNGKGGPVREEPCRRDTSSLNCQWQRGDSVYTASGDAALSPRDVPVFLDRVADLLDSFEVSVH